MGRTSIKSKDPIPLPHDGLLHFYSSKSEEDNVFSTAEYQADINSFRVVQTALICLSKDSASANIYESPTVDLILTLKNATQIKDQLHALQAYRSSILHQRKQQGLTKDTNGASESATGELLYKEALFRILLEWFLSYQTPLPLRRAIQSNLDVLTEEVWDGTSLEESQMNVLSSIWAQFSVWQQPLHSLHEALNYSTTHDAIVLDEERVWGVLQFLVVYFSEQLQPVLETACSQETGKHFFVAAQLTNAVQSGIQWAGIAKTILADAPSMAILSSSNDDTAKTGITVSSINSNSPLLQSLRDFNWTLLTCRATPADALTNLGIAYSRIFFVMRLPTSEEDVSQQLAQHIAKPLPPLTTIAIVQGMAATIPIDIMLRTSEAFRNYFRTQSNHPDPGVRLAALKGIHALVSRCLTRVTSSHNEDKASISSLEPYELDAIRGMTQGTLEIVLQAWENPPNRRLGNAIPSLFQKLISLMQAIGGQSNAQTESFQDLVLRILAQPSNRKGRYKALETLLPIVGSRKMIDLGGWKLMESLLEGIGDRNSHNAGTIAELWANILSDLFHEMLKESSGDKVTESSSGSDKKKAGGLDFEREQIQEALVQWLDVWVPSLSSMLLSTASTRRKQVAAFCLPRVVSMVGGRRRQAAATTFARLLKTIQKHAAGKEGTVKDLESGVYDANRLGDVNDRVLWATLEIARQAHLGKLVVLEAESSELVESIAMLLPLGKLRSALKHFSPIIRLVAFQSIRPIVIAHSPPEDTPWSLPIGLETELWKEAFPYAIKSEGKEYKSFLLQCLTFFMDRLLSEESALEGNQACESLPSFECFVIDFLIHDVAVRRAAYPASIAEKESFSLELLDSILSFASRDDSSKAVTSKSGAVYERRRHDSENAAVKRVMEAMLGREVIAALLSLLHSMWDGVRSSSFRLLSRLILIGQCNKIELSPEYTSSSSRQGMEARAIFLASSPRQREADTGARILAFIYISLREEFSRNAYIGRLLGLLERRLATMKGMLGSMLAGENDPQSGGGTTLPLAHGLVQSLRLMVEHEGFASRYVNPSASTSSSTKRSDNYVRLASVFCQAIQVSLTVVADVKEGSVIAGMDQDLMINDIQGGQRQSVTPGTPLNVNTGAIGANGTFSSVKASDENQHKERIAIQRVVMGSWLLTRETCAALAAILTAKHFSAPTRVINRAGTLLISTLTSLKHAGAAFAAHRSLQQIVEYCFKSAEPAIAKRPSMWAQRLLDEIAETEKVRDSTLRRSTGYALGFLAIMRSEVSSRSESHVVCPDILANILTLSLPTQDELEIFFNRLGLPSTQFQSMFTFLLSGTHGSILLRRKSYEVRSRVHSLNILRLIILDAPLAKEVSPMIGDAIVSAIIGYNDNAWAVRNSSTMVFAAVMLRAIDADKNASNSDATSNNAITFGELFRTYPTLPTFLRSVLSAASANSLETHQGIPPSFPILLLLSRVQSVANSGPESAEMTQTFIPTVFRSLTHRHHGIRTTASLALVNLCSGDNEQSPSSASAMLNGCHALLADAARNRDWNSVHGALLGIKELARSFPQIGPLLRKSGLAQYFLKIGKWEKTNLIFPPVCLSVVLEILSSQSLLQNQVGHICGPLVDRLEKTEAGEIAGASELATTIANIFASHSAEKFWCLESDNQEHQESLLAISSLLTCTRIDVRLHATKTVKKTIYSNVDQLVAADDIPLVHRETRLAAISRVFFEAVQQEIKGCPHPPTLRRLSRCLLECLDAHNWLYHVSVGQGVSLPCLNFIDEIHVLAKNLMGQDQCVNESDNHEETPLTGNAIELLSFLVAYHLRRPEKQIRDDVLKTFRDFSAVIARLNDANLSWRLRHSAAAAVENSQLLSWQAPTGCSEQVSQQMRKIQQSILEEILVMLQDNDPDVRCAAGRAAHKTQKRGIVQSKPAYPSVSQCVLEQTYDYAYRLSSHTLSAEEMRDCASHLLNTISRRCKSLEDKLTTMRAEIMQTQHANNVDGLINTGTDRKIFEDEFANPYEEPALANQLSIRSLIDLDSTTSLAFSAASGLPRQCEDALAAVALNLENNTGDILHELTRSSSIFVELHSLILAVSAIIFLDRGCSEKTSHLRNLAEQILRSAPGYKLHPAIQTALQVMATAQTGSTETRKNIQDCLFLIPATTS